MRYLVIIAHPDDETDIGGTIFKLKQKGHEVGVAVLVSKASARKNLSNTLQRDEYDSMEILEIDKIYDADFPNIKMNVVTVDSVMSFIKTAIDDFRPDVIITHHPADTNNDHYITSIRVQETIKEFSSTIKKIMFMETSAATEWSLNSSMKRFHPNVFVEIGKEGLVIKQRAMEAYKNIIREYPHPSNPKTYEGLAAYRGAQAGCGYAEAFECVYEKV